MKIKNVGELKKFLENFPDNMEIKYYNGMVDDWHNIDVIENVLFKEKPAFTLKLINYQRERNNEPKLTKLTKGSFRAREWEFANEFNQTFLDAAEQKRCFSTKKILLFQGKTRGKSTFDRMGDINY